MLPPPSHTTVVACGSIGLWCSNATPYSPETLTGALASAPGASPRGLGGGVTPLRFVGGSYALSRSRARSVAGAWASYATRTRDAAYSAVSSVSATTSAMGWPLNRIAAS